MHNIPLDEQRPDVRRRIDLGTHIIAMDSLGWYLAGAWMIAWALLPQSARADWISVSGAENAPTIAEIFIDEEEVRIELEIFFGDIPTFARLLPDELLPKGALLDDDGKRPSPQERLRQFAVQDLQVLADGKTLTPTLRSFEPRTRKVRSTSSTPKINPMTGQPVPGPPADKRVLYAELVYALQQPPQTLTFVPPLADDGPTRTTMAFITYHKGVPVHYYMYLGQRSTLTLDWSDPWYSEYDARNLKRWQKGGVMSFLYIEPYEVRHEILARVKDLAAWIDLDLEGTEFIEIDENEPLKQRVGEFLLEQERVRIDGQQLRPILDRVSFVKYAPTASVFVATPERLAIDTTMVGVIITYLTDGIPQEVTSEWSLWSDRVTTVPTDAIDPAGGLPSYVTPDDNVQVWTNYLNQYTIPTVDMIPVTAPQDGIALPWASLACGVLALPLIWVIGKRRHKGQPIIALGIVTLALIAGVFLLLPFMRIPVSRLVTKAPEMTDAEGVALVNDLLTNVYRAFDFREEEDVYDKLAISVHGDLLNSLYLQNRKSFEVQQAGGAQAKVTAIEVTEVQASNVVKQPGTLLLRSTWNALGTVGHWGHIHTRMNHYEASICVEPIDGAWKIVDMTIHQEERVTPESDPASAP